MSAPARWQQITLYLTRGDVAQAELRLELAEALAVTLEDAADEPIFEPALGETPLWPLTRVVALFDEYCDRAAITESLALGSGSEAWWEVIEDTDWTRSWMERFKPIQCGPKLWIVPSWCTAPDAEAVNVNLDPGLAFGTGTHPTTHLCLSWLGELSLHGQRVLDYGCGSGILAVAAAKLGAVNVWAIDIDPQAIAATRLNWGRNALPAAGLNADLPGGAPNSEFDLVVANILAGPLVELADTLIERVAPGGRLALSGLLREQIPAVTAAYSAHIEFDPPRTEGDWVLLTGRRH